MRQSRAHWWCIVLASLAHLTSAVQHDAFPGWKGEISRDDPLVPSQEAWHGEIVQLSWSPRAFLLKGFLTEEECDHLIAKAEPTMKKSAVVDNKTGKSVDSKIRTSTGTFFPKGSDPVISRIEARVAEVSMVPVENQEGLQILHYQDGQKYEPHFDYFHDSYNSRESNGGQRLLTVLMYLTTVEAGGETVFPNADRKVQGPEWSECARKGLAVKTYRGDALMFFSLKPNGDMDSSSLHGSCAVEAGEKWSATKWVHVGAFGGGAKPFNKPGGPPGACIDSSPNCPMWATSGECVANAGWMTDNCRLSCKVCQKT